MAAFILLLMLASPSLAGGNGNVTLRGKLQVSRAGTVVEIEGKRVALTSHDQNIAATLRDSRLDGSDLKLGARWLGLGDRSGRGSGPEDSSSSMREELPA